MSNTADLAKVFQEVEERLASGQYRWLSDEFEPQDYFDWGLNYKTTADSIIQSMIDDGDLEIL